MANGDVLGTSGPIPDSSSQIPTVFGAINSVLQQASNTAAQIRETVNVYQGKTLPQPTLPRRTTTTTELIGIIGVLAIVGVIVWSLLRK